MFDRALATVGTEPQALRTSQSGIDFIKKMEGFIGKARIVLSENEPTGGFGRKGGFEIGEEVTQERCSQLLIEDISIAESDVEAVIPNSEKLSESEFNAVVSLVLNIGRPAFKVSEAAAALNEALSGDERDNEAMERFLFEAFDKDAGFVYAGGKKTKGLVNRRVAERRLFQGTR